MAIADHPLHRSGLALLTHPALALSDNAHAVKWIRVMDSCSRKPFVEQDAHLLPGLLTPTSASAERLIPEATKAMPKTKQRAPVAGYTIILVVAQDHGSEPFSLFLDRQVHPSSKFTPQIVQFPGHPLAYREARDRKHPIPVFAPTYVGESQKVERFRFTLTSPSPVASGPWAKLDDARLLGMQFK